MPASTERVRGRSCLVVALDHLKAGELATARAALRAPAHLSDEAMTSALHAYRRGAALVGEGKLAEAMEHIVPAARALEGSHEAVERHLEQLILVAMASVDVTRGQGAQARKNLARAEELLEQDAFYDEEVAHLHRELKTVVELADVANAVARGDVAAAERELAEVESAYEKAARAEPEGSLRRRVMAARKLWVRVQMETALAHFQIANMDLAHARARLKDAAPQAEALRRAIAELPADDQEGVFRLAASLHADLAEMLSLHDDVLVRHRGLDRKRLKRLDEMRERVGRGSAAAAREGIAAAGILSIYGWIGRAATLVQDAGRHSARADFGRWGGLVSLAATIVLIPVVRFVIEPSAEDATTYYGLAIAMALIAGFGYGALRFRSMLGGVGKGRVVPIDNGQA